MSIDDEFPNPIAHNVDPQSSHTAAQRVTKSGARKAQAEIVFELVTANPESTAVELLAAQAAGPAALGEYQIRRRLTDLLKKGRIIQVIERPCRVRGSQMVTWSPAPTI